MRRLSPIQLNPWREIAVLMIVLMEVSWITPWFRSLTPETYAIDPLRVISTLTILILVAYFLIKAIDYLMLKKSIRRGLIITILIISSFASIKLMIYSSQSISILELINRPIKSFSDVSVLIPVEFIVIVAVLISFWRGISFAQESIGPSAVLKHFWFGIVMYIAFIFLITLVTGENPGDFFFIFLFASLIAISAARMAVIGLVRGGKKYNFEWTWFAGMLLAASFVIGLSSLTSGLFVEKFSWIGGLIIGLFSSVLILMWVIFNPVLTLLILILSRIFQDSKVISELADNLQKLNELFTGLSLKIAEVMEKSGLGELFTRWGPTIKTLVFMGIIGIIVIGIVIWIAIKVWKDRERTVFDNEENFNMSGMSIVKSIIDMLRHNWSRVKNSLYQFTDIRNRQRMRTAARIRQIYRDLMDLCAGLGQPRPDARTPLEYLPKLEQMFPELRVESNRITQAYLGVRYGLLPETQEEINDVETAWNRINTAGQQLLHENKRTRKQ